MLMQWVLYEESTTAGKLIFVSTISSDQRYWLQSGRNVTKHS